MLADYLIRHWLINDQRHQTAYFSLKCDRKLNTRKTFVLHVTRCNMFIKDCRKILKKTYQRTDQKLTIRTHTTLLKTTRQASRITILSTTIQETRNTSRKTTKVLMCSTSTARTISMKSALKHAFASSIKFDPPITLTCCICIQVSGFPLICKLSITHENSAHSNHKIWLSESLKQYLTYRLKHISIWW